MTSRYVPIHNATKATDYQSTTYKHTLNDKHMTPTIIIPKHPQLTKNKNNIINQSSFETTIKVKYLFSKTNLFSPLKLYIGLSRRISYI